VQECLIQIKYQENIYLQQLDFLCFMVISINIIYIQWYETSVNSIFRSFVSICIRKEIKCSKAAIQSEK